MFKSLIVPPSLILASAGLTVLGLPRQAAAQTVLVVENLDGSTREGDIIAAKTTGFTIFSEGPTDFGVRDDFSNIDVVLFGSNLAAAPRDAARNNNDFQAVAQAGRVVVTGIDGDKHSVLGAGQFLQDTITWIAEAQSTGVFGIVDSPEFNWDYLPFPGVTASSRGFNVRDEDVTFIGPPHPIFANTTDGPGPFTLDGWEFSVHPTWLIFGPGNGGYEDDGFLAVASSPGGRCALVAEFVGCPWDCQAVPDGAVNVPDLLALLAQWGLPGSCNFDGGGEGVARPDLLTLLAAWGPCP